MGLLFRAKMFSFLRGGKMVYCPQMKLKREQLIRYGALAVSLVVALLGLILFLLLRGEGRLEAGFALPRVTPTAMATPTVTPARLQVTAPPTPRLVQVQRDYPPGAMDLVADGRVLFTVENAEDGREAVELYLSESADQGLGPDERLIRAGFDQKLSLEEPSGEGKLLKFEEAVNTLKADESLLPTLRTVARCVIDRGTVETVTRENGKLLRGSRIYRNMGVYPYSLSYYETTFRGQAAFSEVKTSEFSLGPGKMDRVVENGTCDVGAASPQAGPEAVEIQGFQPQWPVAGTVSGSFGMTSEGMCYGVEIAADSSAWVVAPAEGVVVYCAERGKLGLVIDVLHDETGCLSRIMGCQKPLVELHQRVKKGEQLGTLPEPVTGKLVTVRYELLVDGLPVNPEKYLPQK